jgi:paraquat-inducible protein B
MSTPPDSTDVSRAPPPQPHRRWASLPGLVWSIPLAALLIVGYLGIHAWATRGEIVTVTFRRAADAHANETKVLYQGVEAGHVIKIVPNKDGKRLDFVIRLSPDAKPGLNSNARFWLIGASPNLSDLSSLKAVVSGVAVGYAPGDGGTPMTRFEGLEAAPIVLPGDRGTQYVLNAASLGSIREGSGLLFHGQPIGKVTTVKFNGDTGFRVEVFVFQPYDALIKPGARFWKMSPLRLSMSGGGFTANLAPASTLLAGGIDLEIETADASSTPAPANTEFTLYGSKMAARQGLTGPTVRYDISLSAAAGDLDGDSAVTLLGFQIGHVESTRLAYDDKTGKPYIQVTAVLYPHQMALAGPNPTSEEQWRSSTDAKLRQLIHLGYRARLQMTPPLIGSESIALVQVKGTASAQLANDSPNPRIPSAPGASDIDDITSQADQILAKVNAIPIEDIGRNLQQATSHLNGLVSSPRLADSMNHLNATLGELDQMLGQVGPQVGPLLTKLNEAAAQISGTALAAHQVLDGQGGAQGDGLAEALQQLTEAARSVRSLTDYLDRHPEALIRGKRPEK